MKKDKIKQLIKRLKTEYIIIDSDISCWYNDIIGAFVFDVQKENNLYVYLENGFLVGVYNLLPKNTIMIEEIYNTKLKLRQKKLERILL